MLYKRLATCESAAEIDDIQEELIDRFGLPETPVKTLIESHRLRLQAKAMGIDSIDATTETITLLIGKHNQIDPANIIQLIQSDKNFRLQGADKLQVKMVNENVEERIRQVKAVLKLLQ